MRESVGRYLRSLWEDYASGEAVAETSGYGALQALLNDAGRELNPSVRAVVNIRNRGAGIPDGGLFTAEQLRRRRRGSDPAADGPTGFPAQLPARGAIEVKGVREDAGEASRGEQVGRYLDRYGQVLVTNYREFVLVGRDRSGDPVEIESFALAENAAGFWQAAESHRETAADKGPALWEFLKRAMLHGAPLSQPRDLAWFLASHAREALTLVEGAGELRALSQVREALEEALGVAFEGRRGEHFFRSTLVQTLFYGVFSAWVLWSKQRAHDSEETFDWRVAAYILNVPMIRALFEQLVMPSRVGALGLDGVLERTSGVLNRVDRAAFFANFDEEGAVQYFYEPFLEAYDPELRKQFGVWYTPREVVRYQVERTDRVLRDVLRIEDGLADDDVYVLDPCTGTGSYLVEVLKKIRGTLAEGEDDGLIAQDLKRAATERVFGFELLPAPFVVAHLQLGLLLQNMGAPLAGDSTGTDGERAGVYLTNALTGWEPREGAKQRLPLPEFEEERDAAEEVKRGRPILVVLGNPPYNGFAGVGMDEERALSDAYRTVSEAPAPEGQGLSDLYVRFFRMAERQIVEGTGRGVVSFISNYSWLDGLSHPGMRERYLEAFDEVWIDSLNGDAGKTGKRTPEGEPDPSVFSTPQNPAGIRVGTAIATLARKPADEHEGVRRVRYRDLWGRDKRGRLLDSARRAPEEDSYEEVEPELALGLPFSALEMSEDYASWAPLPALFPSVSPGVNTSRDLDLVAVDRDRLEERMVAYFDGGRGDEEVRRIAPALMKRLGRHDPSELRRRLMDSGIQSGSFARCAYRPFDTRWTYWHGEEGFLDRPRGDLFRAFEGGNLFLTSRRKAERSREGTPFYATAALPDRHLTRPGSACFPLRSSGLAAEDLFSDHEASAAGEANLSPTARDYLGTLGIEGGRATPQEAGALWMHALAVGYSQAYLSENSGGLWIGWPRIPLPDEREALLASAALGAWIAGLLGAGDYADREGSRGVRGVGSVRRRDGAMLDPGRGDLAVAAGWGYPGTGGVAMPGGGTLTERDRSPEELEALGRAAEAFGLDPHAAPGLLGEKVLDVHLNDVAVWSGVPERAWSYAIGGYQVLKKWLSYREKRLLGRDLRPDEAREFAAMVGKISALLLLGPALDENYRRAAGSVFALPSIGTGP